jgi:hypothetical protein
LGRYISMCSHQCFHNVYSVFLGPLTALADQSGRCSSRALAGVVTGWRMMAVPASSLGDRRATPPKCWGRAIPPLVARLPKHVYCVAVARRRTATGTATLSNSGGCGSAVVVFVDEGIELGLQLLEGGGFGLFGSGSV